MGLSNWLEMLQLASSARPIFCSIYCCNLSRRCLGNLCTLFQVDRIINSAVTNGLFQTACYFIITFCTSVMDKLRAPVVCMSGQHAKANTCRAKKVKNAVRGSNIILQQIRDLWVHTEVRQARCRTNKNTPESLLLNKLCARTRKLTLHEVVKAQCFSLACLERGGLEPASLIPLSNSTSCISTDVTVTVRLIMCTHHCSMKETTATLYTQARYSIPKKKKKTGTFIISLCL